MSPPIGADAPNYDARIEDNIGSNISAIELYYKAKAMLERHFQFLRQKRTFHVIIVMALVGVFALLAGSRMQMVAYKLIPQAPDAQAKIDYKDFIFVTKKEDNRESPLTTTTSILASSKKEDHRESPLLTNRSILASSKASPCWPVLERGSYGQWVPNSYSTAEQRAEVERFIVKVRNHEKLPVSVQRRDGRCGNTNMREKGRPGSLSWIKALCDPAGPDSCCYSNHTCVNLTVSECQCVGCLDLRQQIHAELATWVPHDKHCKMKIFKDDRDVCPLLKNMTIQVIGDSFMRQVFISMLGIVSSRQPGGILRHSNITEGQRQECDKYFMYFSKCSGAIPGEATECGGTALFRRDALWRMGQIDQILKVFEQYVGKPGSFLIFGQGIHDMYHPTTTIEKVLKPVLSVLNKHPMWPQMIWVAPQSPGLLKTPLVKQQQPESVAKFNAVVTPFLQSQGIAVLDGFNITRSPVMSYDGTHFGKGVNDIKAQLLLNYISEIRSGVS